MTKRELARREFLKAGGLSAVGLMLAACVPVAPGAQPAGGQPAATSVINVDWWTVAGADVGNEENQRKVVAAFMESEASRGINVIPTFLPDDGFSEKMNTVLATGAGVPDVTTFWDAGWFPQALDLRELIARDGFDVDIYNKIHFDTRCRFGDEIIGLPIGVGATMYFYNRAMFDKAGLAYPQWGYTMQQFLEDAVAMTDRDNKIFGATMPTRVWRGEFFAFGARPFDEEGKVAEGYMNGPKTVAAFEFMWDLARSGAVPTVAEFDALRTEGTGPLDLFNTGRLGFAGLNNGQFSIVDEAGVDFGLVHNPTVEGEEIITNGWTLQLGIPDASPRHDAAWQWLKYLCGEPGQRFLMELNAGFTPTIPALWADHPAADDERVQFFFEILKTRQVWEFAGRFPYFNRVGRLCQDLYDRIYLGLVERDQIQAELDAIVPVAQETIDTARADLGLS
jgi:ABC-type glycerol-3-phosphate transport system substrate-binding protein